MASEAWPQNLVSNYCTTRIEVHYARPGRVLSPVLVKLYRMAHVGEHVVRDYLSLFKRLGMKYNWL